MSSLENYAEVRAKLEEVLQEYTTNEPDVILESFDVEEILLKLDEATEHVFIAPPEGEDGEEEVEEDLPPETQESNLEEGIFNMVVTLCLLRGERIGPIEARAEVCEYLGKLSTALVTLHDDPNPLGNKETT